MQGTRAPGSRFPGHTSPSPAPALNPTTLLALRLLSLCDFAELLASPGWPGARRTVPADPPQLPPLGFPCESQPRLLTPKSSRAPSPGPPPRPLLCILPMSERPASGWGGSLPFPNDTISLIGLAFCYVPTPVRHEPSLNVKGSGAGGEPEPPWKALVSSAREKRAAEEGNGWRY